MGKKLQFTELDQYLFGQGTNYDIYRKLGAHPDTQNRKKGVYFAVWAPNAQAVSVVGEFNEWDTEKNPMKKVGLLISRICSNGCPLVSSPIPPSYGK